MPQLFSWYANASRLKERTKSVLTTGIASGFLQKEAVFN